MEGQNSPAEGGVGCLWMPTTAVNGIQSFTMVRLMLEQAILFTKPARNHKFSDEMSDSAAQPLVWVSKWIDHSCKYGFVYQLCNESVGVMFNDTTKLMLLPNGINVQYINTNDEESYMTIDCYPEGMDEKMKLLSHYNLYMRKYLVKTGAEIERESDTLPRLHQWCRFKCGIVMQLNNGTVQVNFTDHSKIIVCPWMAAITLIDEDKMFRTFRFSSIKKNGCSLGLYEKMKYAYEMISIILETYIVK